MFLLAGWYPFLMERTYHADWISAFPELVKQNDKGKFVLFGGLPKDIDKKQIIWDLVAKREPQIQWQYTKNSTLKKENYDQSDAYCCVLGFMRLENIW